MTAHRDQLPCPKIKSTHEHQTGTIGVYLKLHCLVVESFSFPKLILKLFFVFCSFEGPLRPRRQDCHGLISLQVRGSNDTRGILLITFRQILHYQHDFRFVTYQQNMIASRYCFAARVLVFHVLQWNPGTLVVDAVKIFTKVSRYNEVWNVQN